MQRSDIEHLGELARIELTDAETDALGREIPDILAYVSAVNDIAAAEKEKKAEGVFNVLRDDVPTHEPGEYTEALLDAAPDRQGRYVRVKKIIGND
jgi:aspartyl-tRNA(Asn)/glutamyl-tRNA(Gln) amidotransferase subunit C